MAEEDIKMPSQEQIKLHKLSNHHRLLILQSEWCGCFFCLARFKPERIMEWVDKGTTARCPNCGMDTVMPTTDEVEVTPELLTQMRQVWFGDMPYSGDDCYRHMAEKLHDVLKDDQEKPN